MSLLPPDPLDPETGAKATEAEPRLLHRGRGEAAQPANDNIFDRVNRARREHTPVARKSGFRIAPATRKLAKVAALLLVLALLGAGAYVLYLRHVLTASLPQIDGTLHVAGLSEPVSVTRDAHGVPSIQAANLDDLLFAQGFVTAQDRLWQMDALRRHGAGELAEILGSKLVAHDKMQRTLRLRASAERALATLPPAQLHQLEAYARGVNALIQLDETSATAHLPLEFSILHYEPRPWTPRDSLIVGLVMAQDLSTEFPTKLSREALSAHLAPELIADLYPVGSWRDHTPGDTGPDLVSEKPEIEQIPLDDSQSELHTPTATPHDLTEARASLLQQTCNDCRSGSNNWAVAGSRSASGMPLVSNDMHLSLAVPDIWYEASLHTADQALDVAGFTLPGTPFVIVGRNAHVAWGFTAMLADTQDVYIERIRNPGANAEFQHPDGSWAAVEHHAELIRVRGGRDLNLDVQTTAHAVGSTMVETPVISALYPSERRTLSMLWTPYDPANVSSPFFGVDTSANGAALVAALGSLGAPSLSVIYADDQNHIGYHAIGRIPVRGPAVQHPVAPPADVAPPSGDAPRDEDDQGASPADSSTAPAGSPGTMTGHPHLVTTLFHGFASGEDSGFRFGALRPRRRHSAEATAPASTPRRKPARVTQAAAPSVGSPIVAKPPEPALFSIGSPIPAVPVDSTDLTAVWSGYVPYEALPAVVDPASGVLATANARVTPDRYPYALALDWGSPYRVERINCLLRNRTGLTPADMLKTQMDTHSELDIALAHRLAYALDQAAKRDASKNSKRMRQAADILRNWNGEVDPGAAAPSIVAATRSELLSTLLKAKIAEHDRAFATGSASAKAPKPEELAELYSWGEYGYVIEQLVLLQPSRWLPFGARNWNELLTSAVEHGLASAHAPSDLALWSYSKAHPVELNHPLLSSIPAVGMLLGVATGTGPHVVGGDTSTIKATARSFGPSERFTADLSSTASTQGNITTGQSGNPASSYYMDQLPFWLGGATLALPLNGAGKTHTLVLQP